MFAERDSNSFPVKGVGDVTNIFFIYSSIKFAYPGEEEEEEALHKKKFLPKKFQNQTS